MNYFLWLCRIVVLCMSWSELIINVDNHPRHWFSGIDEISCKIIRPTITLTVSIWGSTLHNKTFNAIRLVWNRKKIMAWLSNKMGLIVLSSTMESNLNIVICERHVRWQFLYPTKGMKILIHSCLFSFIPRLVKSLRFKYQCYENSCLENVSNTWVWYLCA